MLGVASPLLPCREDLSNKIERTDAENANEKPSIPVPLFCPPDTGVSRVRSSGFSTYEEPVNRLTFHF